MKKTLKFFLFVVGIITMFSLGGCIKDNDDTIVRNKFESFFASVESADKDEIRQAFSVNKINGILGFEENIDSLIAYYDGTFVFRDITLGMIANKDGKKIEKHYEITAEIQTSTDIYRIAVLWYVKDTEDPNNIGIWSLYILNKKDDIETDYSYWGDNLWTPGINVGVPGVYPED